MATNPAGSEAIKYLDDRYINCTAISECQYLYWPWTCYYYGCPIYESVNSAENIIKGCELKCEGSFR